MVSVLLCWSPNPALTGAGVRSGNNANRPYTLVWHGSCALGSEPRRSLERACSQDIDFDFRLAHYTLLQPVEISGSLAGGKEHSAMKKIKDFVVDVIVIPILVSFRIIPPPQVDSPPTIQSREDRSSFRSGPKTYVGSGMHHWHKSNHRVYQVQHISCRRRTLWQTAHHQS